MPDHRVTLSTPRRPRQQGHSRWSALAAVAVIALGLGLAYWLLSAPPRVERRAVPAAAPPQVDVTRIASGPVAPELHGYGRVVAARQTDIAAQVPGRLIDFAEGVEPGRVVDAGAALIRLDDSEYRLAVRGAEAELAQAEASLAIERGEQIRAQSEYQSFGRKLSAERRALVLREPQLKSAQAVVASAQAALDSAELDLQHTHITAPYRAMVQQRLVGPGSEVSASTALLSVVDVSHFWVRVSMPSEALDWLATGKGDAKGAAVTLTSRGWAAGAQRQGRVFSVLPSLEENGLMAQLLVRVDDPLALDAEGPALRLGDVVNATFEATPRDGLVALPTAALRSGDRLWTLDDENQLRIRQVAVVHRGEERVLIDASQATMTPGQRVIVSPLGQPREGMTLRPTDEDASTARNDDAHDDTASQEARS